jgi:hypothetical protein
MAFMPWKKSEPMEERIEFALKAMRTLNFRALCEEYGIRAKKAWPRLGLRYRNFALSSPFILYIFHFAPHPRPRKHFPMHNTQRFLLTFALLVCSSWLAGAQTGRLANLSTRAFCKTGEAVLVNEFVVQGTGTETLLMRGIGPSLANFGVPGALKDPTVLLFDARGHTLDANNDWMDNPDKDEIIATGIPPTDPRESAIIDTLRPGLYTFVEQGVRRTQGVALPEIYDLLNGGLQLSAVGTRAFVSTGDNVMISGFILTGSAPVSLLIRALGPSLTNAGLSRVLADPQLELHDASGQLIFSDDNWRDTQEAEIIATGLAPTDDRESAIVVTLNPGLYTNVLTGVGATTGIGFLQIYSLELPIRELNPAPIIRGSH